MYVCVSVVLCSLARRGGCTLPCEPPLLSLSLSLSLSFVCFVRCSLCVDAGLGVCRGLAIQVVVIVCALSTPGLHWHACTRARLTPSSSQVSKRPTPTPEEAKRSFRFLLMGIAMVSFGPPRSRNSYQHSKRTTTGIEKKNRR